MKNMEIEPNDELLNIESGDILINDDISKSFIKEFKFVLEILEKHDLVPNNISFQLVKRLGLMGGAMVELPKCFCIVVVEKALKEVAGKDQLIEAHICRLILHEIGHTKGYGEVKTDKWAIKETNKLLSELRKK